MDIALVVVVVFVALLVVGWGQLAQGANAHVANGAVLLTLAAIAGVLAVGLLSSFDLA